MKKLTALLLALLLLLSVTACAAKPAEEPASAEEPAAVEPAAEPAAEPAEEPAEEPAAPAEETVTLTASSAFTATQLPGIFWEYFKEQLESLSGGSLKLDLYLGGTLCGPDEEMNMISNGSLDMMMAFVPANAFFIPSVGSIYYTPADIESTQKVIKHILFDDEASSAAIAADFAKNNATLLPSFMVTSETVFCSKQPVTCWADFYEGKFGCPMDANYTDMGYKNLVTVMDADWYESMRTGLCDSLQVTAADVVSSKLYEVADYFLVCPANRVDHFLTINTDKLNSLSDAQRDALYQACDKLMAYTIEYQDELTEQFEQVVSDNGGTVLNMTQDEADWFLYCGDVLGWQTGLETLAVATDSVDAMTAVQAANREGLSLYTDCDVAALEAKFAQ